MPYQFVSFWNMEPNKPVDHTCLSQQSLKLLCTQLHENSSPCVLNNPEAASMSTEPAYQCWDNSEATQFTAGQLSLQMSEQLRQIQLNAPLNNAGPRLAHLSIISHKTLRTCVKKVSFQNPSDHIDSFVWRSGTVNCKQIRAASVGAISRHTLNRKQKIASHWHALQPARGAGAGTVKKICFIQPVTPHSNKLQPDLCLKEICTRKRHHIFCIVLSIWCQQRWLREECSKLTLFLQSLWWCQHQKRR